MAVSANTLFHFTKKDTLKAILSSSKFYPSYSEEHFENILPKSFRSHHTLYIPIVSFCDLTIMQLARDSKHTKDYSKYGIGLKKEWGTENRISPITYVHHNSPPANQILTLYNHTNRPKVIGNAGHDELLLIKRHMTDAFKYLKPYQGHWHKANWRKEITTYYDEREWRFSPKMDDFEILFMSELKKIAKAAKSSLQSEIANRNSSLRKFSFVNFDANDIKYIIVDKEVEVEEFAKWIRKNKKTPDQSTLISKLISFEKIETDF